MEIFERVEKLLNLKGESRYSLAKRLSIAQTTLNGYFDIERQDKLRPHLWAILKLFPDVQRDWLFFDEGEMLKTETPGVKPACEPVTLPATPDVQAELEGLRRENVELNVELRGALKELRRLNEERRELEERLKANTIDPGPFAFDPPAESVSAGRPARGVSGADVLGQCNKN